jgi:hypothetical protein
MGARLEGLPPVRTPTTRHGFGARQAVIWQTDLFTFILTPEPPGVRVAADNHARFIVGWAPRGQSNNWCWRCCARPSPATAHMERSSPTTAPSTDLAGRRLHKSSKQDPADRRLAAPAPDDMSTSLYVSYSAVSICASRAPNPISFCLLLGGLGRRGERRCPGLGRRPSVLSALVPSRSSAGPAVCVLLGPPVRPRRQRRISSWLDKHPGTTGPRRSIVSTVETTPRRKRWRASNQVRVRGEPGQAERRRKAKVRCAVEPK